jgi:hypothetical protein
MILRNVGTLPHHYNVLMTRRPPTDSRDTLQKFISRVWLNAYHNIKIFQIQTTVLMRSLFMALIHFSTMIVFCSL